jgi:hypothetical protein
MMVLMMAVRKAVMIADLWVGMLVVMMVDL